MPELHDAAAEAVRSSIERPESVSIEAVTADAAAEDLSTRVPRADLLWASGVVHHLPDQQAALNRLAGLLRSGGTLALAEAGLVSVGAFSYLVEHPAPPTPVVRDYVLDRLTWFVHHGVRR